MKRLRHLAGATIVATLAWSGAALANAVTDWNEIAVGAVGAGRLGPIGIVDLALVQAAAHDAVQAIEKRYEPYYADIQGSKGRGSTSAAVAAAVHGVLVGFYPAQAATLDPIYATYLANNGLTGNLGIAVGEKVAALYLPLRRLDPNPLPPPFTGPVPAQIGQWRPTESFLGGPPAGPPPTLAPMAVPWMGSFDPFTLTGPARFRAPPPPILTSAQYTTDYNEVKEKGALTGSTRTPEETDIAYFWSDNPVAIWNRGIRTILIARNMNNGISARLLALANLSTADAIITAWDSKKFFNIWRPVTAIREGELDGNPNTAGDPAWQSLINNPNYPDYTSGANNVSGAMSETLRLFFNKNAYTFVLTSGAPAAVVKARTYSSFSAAAQQVVDARVLLGIHFRFADTAARTQGRSVAAWVHNHFLLPTGN